jgi:hypothetical protein
MEDAARDHGAGVQRQLYVRHGPAGGNAFMIVVMNSIYDGHHV